MVERMKECPCLKDDKWCGKCGCRANPSGPAHCHSGKRCARLCGKALTRCTFHGGSTDTAISKAKHTMALLRMPAIEGLYRVIEHMMVLLEQHAAKTCPTCGYPSMDVDEMEAVTKTALVITKSAQTVLDRCDMGPKATLEIKQGDGDLDINAMTDYERDELFTALATVRAVKESIRRRLSGITDAVIVPPAVGQLAVIVLPAVGQLAAVDAESTEVRSAEVRSADGTDPVIGQTLT